MAENIPPNNMPYAAPSSISEVPDESQRKNGRVKMLLVLAVCLAPVLASYFTYYVIKPTGRTNYGSLIAPQDHPTPQLGATTLDGKPAALDAYRGKWILFQAGGGQCDELCRDNLLVMRQERLMQGKEQDRIERVWLITDDAPLDTVLMREYDSTHMLRVKADILQKWLPVEDGNNFAGYIYVVDPLGNLMFRFPKKPDHAKMKKDITKLLTASSIG